MLACALWLARDFGLSRGGAALAAGALHLAAFAIFLRRLVWWRDDVREPWWRVWLIETPYAVFASGAFLAAVPGYGLALGWAVGRGAGLVDLSLLDLLAVPLGVGLALGLVGSTVGRAVPVVRETEVRLPGLHPSLDGYCIVQLSDVHCGPYVPRWLWRYWARRAVSAGGDLVAVTGDLITVGEGYLDDVAGFFAALSAPDGVYACMGNHDYFQTEEGVATAIVQGGATLLRNRGVTVRRGDGGFYLAGLDDRWSKRDDLDAALRDAPPGVPQVLLAHDPQQWPAFVARGVALTLSGHTHAGQFGLPGALSRVNLSRLITRHTEGLYAEGASQLYVHRGVGITAVPTRVFMWPEIARIVLRCGSGA